MRILDVVVIEDFDGMRLDKFLSESITDISRSRIQALIKEERVEINGQSGKWASSKVRSGMHISVKIPDPENLDVVAQDIPIPIIFEDDDLIVVDKPAGMVVHPAPGNTSGTLVNALLHHCRDNLSGIGGVKRPGIVHRIDKDTSGLLVVAKSDKAHQGLTELFKNHTIDRCYSALVWGTPFPQKGTVSESIARNKNDRKKMAVVSGHDVTGKKAVTHYNTLKHIGARVTHLECRLETGRTHQIRVHMTHMGHSLVGDPVYGKIPKGIKACLEPEDFEFLKNINRQALHAKELGFIHPVSGEKMFFESPIPNDIETLEKILSSII